MLSNNNRRLGIIRCVVLLLELCWCTDNACSSRLWCCWRRRLPHITWLVNRRHNCKQYVVINLHSMCWFAAIQGGIARRYSARPLISSRCRKPLLWPQHKPGCIACFNLYSPSHAGCLQVERLPQIVCYKWLASISTWLLPLMPPEQNSAGAFKVFIHYVLQKVCSVFMSS